MFSNPKEFTVSARSAFLKSDISVNNNYIGNYNTNSSGGGMQITSSIETLNSSGYSSINKSNQSESSVNLCDDDDDDEVVDYSDNEQRMHNNNNNNNNHDSEKMVEDNNWSAINGRDRRSVTPKKDQPQALNCSNKNCESDVWRPW